jgi:hypothetical protein
MEELKYKVGIETDRIEPSDLIDPGVINTLVELNNEIESYKSKLKELEKLEKEQGKLTRDQSRLQEQLKLDLKSTQDQYREIQTEIKKVDVAVRSGANSYKGLVEENKALMDAMRNIPFDDTTGELEKLQAQYNANNETLKQFDEELGNHQRNVGNYTSALNGTGNILNKLPNPLRGVNKAVQVFNATLKANPLGLVVAAVAGLIAILSKLEPVQKLINHLTMVFGETLTFVSNALSTLIDGQERNVRSLKDQIALVGQLKKAEENLAIIRSQTPEALANVDQEIAKINLNLAKGNLTEKERNDLLDLRAKRQEELLVLKENELIADKNLLSIEYERAKNDEERQEVREKIGKIQSALTAIETARIVNDTNLLNEQSELRKKSAEEQRKRAEKDEEERIKAAQSLAEARKKITNDYLDDLQKMRNTELDLADTLIGDIDTTDLSKGTLLVANLFNETLKEQTILRLQEEGKLVEAAELEKQFRIQELTQMFIDAGVNEHQAALDAQAQANLEYSEDLKRLKEQEAEFQRQMNQDMLKDAISIGQSLFGKTKALAVAQAIIDTWASANSAAKNTPGGVLAKSLAAAAMVAKGFANVKKILSTKPGGGASGGTSAGSAVSTASTLSPAGIMMPQSFSGQSPFATGMASSVGDPAMNRGEINIQANVDRRGLAIAVREGERSIRTQQFDYR